MASAVLLAFGFAAVLAIVHFFGERIDERWQDKPWLTEFVTGMTVTYIFLQLLPELYAGVTYLGHHAFLFALGGFAAMHLAEKYIYNHEKDATELGKDFKELHTVFLFIYHFSLGIIIKFLVMQSVLEGALFAVPVIFHTAASSLSLKELHEEVLENTTIKALVAGSAIFGVAATTLLDISLSHYHGIIGVVTGMFMYVVITDSLTPERNDKPRFFLAGTVLYTAIILATWAVAG